MVKKNVYTSIQVTKKFKTFLRLRKRPAESYEDFIKRKIGLIKDVLEQENNSGEKIDDNREL